MAPTFSRGDVVLTQFPFTDLTGASVRPALVVSQGLIGQDVVVAGISSVVRGPLAAPGAAGRPGGLPLGGLIAPEKKCMKATPAGKI